MFFNLILTYLKNSKLYSRQHWINHTLAEGIEALLLIVGFVQVGTKAMDPADPKDITDSDVNESGKLGENIVGYFKPL